MKTLKEAAEEYQSKAETPEKKVLIWDPMLRIVRQDFIDACFGWRWQLANRQQTWRTEQLLAAKHSFEPRKYLFPAYHAVTADKAEDDKIRDEKEKAKAEEHRLQMEQEKKREQEQKDLPAMNEEEKNLLTCIAEKLGEGRYSTWFGNHSICKVEESEKQVVFSVRNSFMKNGIRRHCNSEVEEVITEQMPAGFRVVYEALPVEGGAS